MKYITRFILDLNRIKDWKEDHSVILGWEGYYYESALLFRREDIINIPESLNKYIINDFSGFENTPEDINDYYAFLLPWIFPTIIGRHLFRHNIDDQIIERFNHLLVSFLGVNS